MRQDIDLTLIDQDSPLPKPLSEIDDLSKAIQSALSFDSLRDAVAFVCMWDEFRRTGSVTGSSCFGAAVTELLRIYGIDLDRIRS
jgi:hypothetical protein